MAKVPWPMTTQTYHRYQALLDQMAQAAHDNDQLAYEQARDQFRALPGMPQGLNEDLDLVVPVIQDTGHTIISIGSTH